jgi:predicted O-methyltransferase YrrM
MFSCRMFYYYLNVLHQNAWPGTLALKRCNLNVPQNARAWHWNAPTVGTGWHYSYLGGEQQVRQKVKDFCHAEYDTSEVHAALPGRVRALTDPFDRLPDPMPVVPLEGPAWLLEHRDAYVAYIHAPLCQQERIDQAIAYAKQVQGLISHYEMQWLAAAATTHPNIIEIGSWQGRSTKLLAMATDGMVYTTDNFSQSFIIGNDGGYVQQQFNHNLRQQIQLGKVVHLNLPSVAAARELLPRLGRDWADMVFVDGDHRGDCAEQDIRAYWPLLRPGGLLCGHDIQDEPVRASLQRVIPDWLPAPGMLWYHVKQGAELGSL